jgi:hypothetical protein
MPMIPKEHAAAIKVLQALKKEVVETMDRARKVKGRPSEVAMSLGRRQLQTEAIDMAIACLSGKPRAKRTSMAADPTGIDPASQGGG